MNGKTQTRRAVNQPGKVRPAVLDTKDRRKSVGDHWEGNTVLTMVKKSSEMSCTEQQNVQSAIVQVRLTLKLSFPNWRIIFRSPI